MQSTPPPPPPAAQYDWMHVMPLSLTSRPPVAQLLPRLSQK